MIIILETDIQETQKQALESQLKNLGLRVVGIGENVWELIGEAPKEKLLSLPGIQEVIAQTSQKGHSFYRGVYRVGWKSPHDAQGLWVGGECLLLCAELSLPFSDPTINVSDTQIDLYLAVCKRALKRLRDLGVSFFSYRPVGSLNSWIAGATGSMSRNPQTVSGPQPSYLQQAQFFSELKRQVDMPLLVEVSSLKMAAAFSECADILQISAQQMRNTELLAELAGLSKVLVLQCVADADLEEFLLAAEFLQNLGQTELILGETFMPNPSRSGSQMLDFANIHLLQQLSHCPVFVNLLPPLRGGRTASTLGWQPAKWRNFSSGTSCSQQILCHSKKSSDLSSLALAALAAGAQGIEFALSSKSLLNQFLSPSEKIAWNAHSPDENACKNAQFFPSMFAEWDESLYIVEQLGQMAMLLQKELVRLPVFEDGQKNDRQDKKTTKKDVVQIAFQGEPGAYSEQALRQFFDSESADWVFPRTEFGAIQHLPFASFREIFEAVQSGIADFAIVPLENSLAGSIAENYDLLLEYSDLCICAETRLRVSHALIGIEGSTLEQIRVVRSHPQALAQSSHFLQKYNLQPLANFDTAGSVRELKERPEVHIGVIASILAAEIYNMKILVRHIENNPHNYTRFAIVCRSDSQLLRSQMERYEQQSAGAKFGDKWSFCFRLRNFAGSLATALQLFQKYELNLSKLESRPIMGQPWSYRFYLDTRISRGFQQEEEFFRELGQISEEYRVIGRYRENLK